MKVVEVEWAYAATEACGNSEWIIVLDTTELFDFIYQRHVECWQAVWVGYENPDSRALVKDRGKGIHKKGHRKLLKTDHVAAVHFSENHIVQESE